MRGKSKYKKQNIKPDQKFNSILVTELVNKIQISGKKENALNIVYKAFEIIEKNTKKKPLEVFEHSIKIASPEVEVKSKRIGGANYQIPVEVSSTRKIDLVLRWLINAARTKKGKSMDQKLANEILYMYKGEGAVIKKRDDVHKMAEANKAFAHFARF